jgi:hypothetical protein
MLFAGKWMKPEIIMLSKINQTQKDKYHVFSHIWNLMEREDMKVESRLLGKRIWIGKGDTREENGGI